MAWALASVVLLLHDALMGITRKALSLSTAGMVSWRSKGERVERFTRQTRNAARAQVAQQAMSLEQQRQLVNQGDVSAVRAEVQDMRTDLPLAGWFADQLDPSLLRWWDGFQWTNVTRPR